MGSTSIPIAGVKPQRARMDSDPVAPLRITKSISNSPFKMARSAIPRPLVEVNPMGIRRNSGNTNNNPSEVQNENMPVKHDSSPFDPSPKSSRSFWKIQETLSPSRVGNENAPVRQPSPSPTRRASLENLKKASRVTHNSIFGRENDPTDKDAHSSAISDSNVHPSNVRIEGNSWLQNGMGVGRSPFGSLRGHSKIECETTIPRLTPQTSTGKAPGSRPSSPLKEQVSPQKSSLSGTSRYVSDNELTTEASTTPRDETPRPVLRQPKSVSFDVAPPQINEYEKPTPDVSVASDSRENSCEFDSEEVDFEYDEEALHGHDDSFDESLEDAEKTPVVLPEDWRFIKPDVAHVGLAENFDDPFQGHRSNSTSSIRNKKTLIEDAPLGRTSSVRSSGESRPLPPLPSLPLNVLSQLDQQPESISRFWRSQLTAPLRASVSKEEIRSMRESPMPLDERLRILSIQQQESESRQSLIDTPTEVHDPYSTNAEAHEPKTPETLNAVAAISQAQDDDLTGELAARRFEAPAAQEYQLQTLDFWKRIPTAEDAVDYANLDPDVPIQSRETSSSYDDTDIRTRIKQETEDDAEGIFGSPVFQFANDLSVKGSKPDTDFEFNETKDTKQPAPLEGHVPTFEDATISSPEAGKGPVESESTNKPRMSLPEFASFMGEGDFGLGMQKYLSPSRPDEEKDWLSRMKPQEKFQTPAFSRPVTPTHQVEGLTDVVDEQEMGTPESVIHYTTHEEEQEEDESMMFDDGQPSELQDSLIIPEPVATIKASGSKLKTRPSATPADLRAMAAARRQVSGEKPLPLVPDDESENDDASDSEESGEEDEEDDVDGTEAAIAHGQDLNLKLEVPLDDFDDEGGFRMEEEFDRVIEAQKRGYLMRQNTKIVVASNRNVSEENKDADAASHSVAPRARKTPGSGPRRPSGNTWKAEPWNGKTRRQSTRRSNIVPEKRLRTSAIPPISGHESLTTGTLGSLPEDELLLQEGDTDGSERGRLFVKVVGIKDLDLPLPKDERCQFQLTLDNGLHCVTTNWAELGRTAPIGQEFELVVFDDLEFQLTLQTRLQRPKSLASTVTSTSVPSLKPMKTSKLTRLLSLPKKRREQDQQHRVEEEAQAALQKQRDLEQRRAAHRPSAWDLQHELVGPDGSFARAYVNLSNHEKQAFGRPLVVDIPCFNEWAVEDKTIASSTRSKLGPVGIQRRPPYKIGKIELQLMYIPKPMGVDEEDLPKSISAAIRQLKEREVQIAKVKYFEGQLSQQGGDCPYWRRRFFKLEDSRLVAFHETTRQVRATIDLARAVKLIDGRSSLTQSDASSSPSKALARRKSAFAEDEEGFMFVEEGFRIRFANGESIDFYADSPQQKDEWMRALSEVMHKDSAGRKVTWMDAILARERLLMARKHLLQEEKLPIRGASKQPPTSPVRKAVGSAPTPKSNSSNSLLSIIEQSPMQITPPSPSKAQGSGSPSKRLSAQPALRVQDGTTGRRQAGKSIIC